MKKRALIWLIAIVLAVILSIMGTIAYLTDVVGVTNVMTVGNVDIELLEYERISVDDKDADANVHAFTQDKPLYPAVVEDGFSYSGLDYSNPTAYVDWTSEGKEGYKTPIWDPDLVNNEVDKMVFVKNTGDNDAYVRVFYAFEVGAYTNLKQFEEKVHLNKNDTDWTWEWDKYIAKQGNSKFFIAVATYNRALAPNEITEVSLSQILLDPVATNVDVKSFGDYFDVHVFAQAIQTQSFDGPESALETGFGSDIPFPDMTIYRGEELKIALNNFEANITNPEKITSKVTRVTFGTKEQYPDIVNDETLTPTLTLNEYDTPTGKEYGAPTHTYYVPDGDSGNYHLYVLADEGKIYTPKNSDSLFRGMESLIEVDTSNLDVSHTTDMSYMFYNCHKLQTIDTSSWNVSNVTTMTHLFRHCYDLKELDVLDWDVSNVKSMSFMFHSCYDLKNIDVIKWDVSALVDMGCIFEACQTFTSLEVSNWNTQSVTYTGCAFRGCSNLQTIDVSGWKVDNVTDMAFMFQGCGKLSSQMDLSKWDVSKVENMQYLFSGCQSVPSLNVSGWNVAKVTNFTYVFSGCSSLTELDVKNWDVSSATSMQGMFYNCSNLPSLDLSAWGDKLNGVTTMQQMFQGCSSLTSLNVSTWDVSTVTNMYGMFRGCSALTSLNISDWNVQNVTSMGELFCDCKGLTKIDLSGWNTVALTNTSYMFCRCDKLVTIFVGDGWNVSKVTSSDHMFDNCFKLVGGENTKFVSNITDKTYAIIDGEDGKPGYLTKGPAPANP